MPVIYNNGHFHYQQYKFSDSKKVLRILPGNTEYKYRENYLFVPRLWNDELKDLVKDKEYDYVVFDDKLFLQSNIKVESTDKFSKFPSGETCIKIIVECIKKGAWKNSFLVVQDDGTRSMLPPMFYALKSTNNLRIRKAYKNHGINSPVYIDNFTSTSNTKGFTRATHKFSYFDYLGYWDYIITPVCKDRISDQIRKLEKEANIAYIIYGSISALEKLKYTKKIIIGRSCFIYKEKNCNKKPKELKMNSVKNSTAQLAAFLQKDYK